MTERTPAFTKTDSAANEWAIDDDVVRLREWGTDKVHDLPQPPILETTVGSAEGCGLRLDDSMRRVSRQHARVVRDRGRWLLVDLDSKNGVRADGARRGEIVLTPGLELGIGGLTLIAESPLSIALRGFLARLLGWSDERVPVVDHAMRAIRIAAARRAALVMCGEGDLVPTAHSIHRHARGAERPFIVCDPRRQRARATVRSAEGYATGMEALAAATGGSICVRAQRLPPDFGELVETLRSPLLQVQLIVCGETEEECARHNVTPIAIPPLADRTAELDRIIHEYSEEAIAEIGKPGERFAAADLAWVREHASASLHEIEKATLRLMALRTSRSLGKAASRLGMARVSLARWIGRRQMPMKIDA